MKKSLIFLLVFVLVVSFVFASCASKTEDENIETVNASGLEDVDEEYGFETEEVTDENGEEVTDENGDTVTTEVAVVYTKDKKGKTIAQKIDESGEKVTNKKGNPVTVKSDYVDELNETSDNLSVTSNAASSVTSNAVSNNDTTNTNSPATTTSAKQSAENSTTKSTTKKSDGTSTTKKSGTTTTAKNNSSTTTTTKKATGTTTTKKSGTTTTTKSNGATATTKNTTTTTKKNSSTTTTKKNSSTTTTTEKPTATTKKNVELTKDSQTTKFDGTEVVPKTSDTGKEVNFSKEDQEIVASMLEVPYLYLANYENSDGVPIEIANYVAVWMAQQDGGTAEVYPSNPVVLNLFKFFGQTVVNFKTKCNDYSDSPIKYDKSNDTFKISSYPNEKQTITITKIEDMGNNNYYKITGTVKNAGSKKKVVAIIQKNRLEPSLGFSIKALKWS